MRWQNLLTTLADRCCLRTLYSALPYRTQNCTSKPGQGFHTHSRLWTCHRWWLNHYRAGCGRTLSLIVQRSSMSNPPSPHTSDQKDCWRSLRVNIVWSLVFVENSHDERSKIPVRTLSPRADDHVPNCFSIHNSILCTSYRLIYTISLIYRYRTMGQLT